LESYLKKNQELLERNSKNLENYLDLQSSIITKKLKDYDVSKMVIKESKESHEKPINDLKKDLLTNNTSMGPVNYAKEIERKKKIFMTENIEEANESERTPKKIREATKFIAQRNTRYDNNLTESSQVPELTSKIRKNQGMNLLKSNSMKKLKHLDTNQVIEDCDVEMTNYQNLTIEEDQSQSQSQGDKSVSVILQKKINEFMTNKTDSQTSYSRRFPRPTNETTLGSIMDFTIDKTRGRFLTQNNSKKPNLGNYQIIQNQFRTNTPSQVEKVGNSHYIKTVVQKGDAVGLGTKIEEEEGGVEMGEIMIDNQGKLKSENKSHFKNQIHQLREEQKLNELEFEKAKKNQNHDDFDLKEEEPNEELNKSIRSDLFEEKTPKKREVSKSPELLVITNDAPVKKRRFKLGKSRKSSRRPKKKQEKEVTAKVKDEKSEQKDQSEQNEQKEQSSNHVSHHTKNIDIEMPKEVPKAMEINLGFDSKCSIGILIN
jgi:hypothetical protein